jgi:glycosyltransferase involved in cell wall biosynthesis
VILGDRGIPARYGGFSTLVEEVALRLVATHGMEVTVYCRKPYYSERPAEYRGVRCVYLPAPGGKSLESILSSNLSIGHAALQKRYDLAFIVDPGNGPFVLPLIARGIPRVMHTDGLGWQRTKWNRLQRAYYKWSERVCAALSTWLVTDSRVMSRYYVERYGAESSFIPYGCETGPRPNGEALLRFGVERGGYLLCVARLEPENNVDLIVREYKRSGSKFPLLVVGASPYPSAHARSVLAMADDRVRCLGSVFEPEILNGLYRDCRFYLHGHEVGGTNPSLLRAMGAGAPCVAIDVPFHREVLGSDGIYFSKESGALAARIKELEGDSAALGVLAERGRSRAETLYRWDAVAAAYAELFEAVIRASRAGRRFRPDTSFEPYRPLEFGSHASSVD